MHQTIIVVIGYYVIRLAWSPWTKYFVILALTMAACFALYQGCIRRVAPLRFAFGMKPTRDAVSLEVRPVQRPLAQNDVQ